MAIQIFGIIFLVPAVLVSFYYLFLAVAAIVYNKDSNHNLNAAPIHSFAVVIPAHNEEHTIREVLQSCNNLNYILLIVDCWR